MDAFILKKRRRYAGEEIFFLTFAKKGRRGIGYYYHNQ